MDRFISVTLYLIFVLGTMMFCSEVTRAEVFEVRELSFEAGKYTSNKARDSYLLTPGSGALLHRTLINWDVDLWCSYLDEVCLFWDNKVHAKASESRYRLVGWEFETGLHLGKVDIFYYHHSQHMLDQIREDNYKFPVEDAITIRLNFILNPRR